MRRSVMKKRICIVMIVVICMFFLGCSKEDAELTNSVSENQEMTDKKENIDANKEQQTDGKDEFAEKDSLRSVNIYQVSGDGSGIIAVKEDVKDEYDIWEKLIEAGILDENCELLSFYIDNDAKTIDVNFNRSVGNRIRNMGTTGEQEIIGCIVNTYLEAYGCDKIELFEEGQNLETGHGALLNGYMKKYDL